MERACGDLQRNLGSKSAPSSNLDKRVVHNAYIDQLGCCYDLADELAEVGKRPRGTPQYETICEGCKCSFNLCRVCGS